MCALSPSWSYCDASAHLLTDILRVDWGFSGLVESDWVLGTHGSATSVMAGLDIEMPAAVRFGRCAPTSRAGRSIAARSLTLHADDLRFWNTTTSTWVLEPSDYELDVDAHAGDARVTSTLHAAP